MEFLEIDIFKNWSQRADVFLMSRILHDWDDERALKILKTIASNMHENSKLLLFETIVPKEKVDLGVTLSFHLLNFLGGRERSLREFKKLLKKVNLKVVAINEGGVISMMEIAKK